MHVFMCIQCICRTSMPSNTDVITKSKIAKHTNIGEGQEMGELRWADMVQGTLHKRIWMDGWMDGWIAFWGTRIRVCERENVRQIRSDHTRHCVCVCVCVTHVPTPAGMMTRSAPTSASPSASAPSKAETLHGQLRCDRSAATPLVPTMSYNESSDT